MIQGKFSEEAIQATAKDLLARLEGQATTALAFVSNDYLSHLEELTDLIRLHAHVPEVFGCSGSGLIGSGIENENDPGVAILLFDLPRTKLSIFEFDHETIDTPHPSRMWQEKAGIKPDELSGWIILGNPFKFKVHKWLGEWNQAYPNIPCVGGMASGQEPREQVFVFRNDKLLEGLALGFDKSIQFRAVLSQGCRPIGEPLTVTRVQDNVIFNMGSHTAYEVLDSAFGQLTEEDKKRARGNLFAGIATSEYVDDFKQGDFLIRSILGADPNKGAVVVGEYVRVGQTMQYQLRDDRSADEDLNELLKRERILSPNPFACLLFSCLGRGEGLFGMGNHDAGMLVKIFGQLPFAGFFCNAEIGPVGSKNFVHGYTASMVFLVDAEPPK